MNRRILLLVLLLTVLAVVGAGTVAAQTSPATWFVTYYNNESLSGDPVYTSSEGVIDHNWGSGAPANGVNADHWSARWTTYKDFEAGTYRFTVTSDDGARIFLGDKHIHVDWEEHGLVTSYIDVSLTGGRYPIAVDYFDDVGNAQLKLGWQRTGAAVAGAADVTVIRRGTIGTPSPTPTDFWRASYWNNRSLSGSAVVSRNEVNVDYNWGNGSPAGGVNADNWSARWTRRVSFGPGTYRFRAVSDDGVRVWVGDRQIINDWSDHAAREASATVTLSAGTYPVTVEFYEHGGGAVLRFWWEYVGGTTPPSPAPSGSWYATYYNNRDLQGTPVRSRNETSIDYNWGNGSPLSGVNADNWSARWTRSVYFPAGTYRFTAISDDGVRVFVGDQHIINDWSEHAARAASATVTLPEGTHPVAVDYFEAGGEARLHVSWQRVSDSGTGTGGISAQTRVNLRLRAGPSTAYTILDVVPTGTIVPIMARTESGDWIQVQYRGRLGWMYTGFTTVYGDLDAVPVG